MTRSEVLRPVKGEQFFIEYNKNPRALVLCPLQNAIIHFPGRASRFPQTRGYSLSEWPLFFRVTLVPAAAPKPASSMFSASTCRTSLKRVAPTARRTAISFCRAAPRSSRSPATLVQTISSNEAENVVPGFSQRISVIHSRFHLFRTPLQLYSHLHDLAVDGRHESTPENLGRWFRIVLSMRI